MPAGPLAVTCDIGIYFDVDGTIDGAAVNGTVADAKSVQYGIYVDGVDVDVTNSSVGVEAAYPGQFVSVTYRDGATGTISHNSITGAHRAGIGIRGSGTDVTVSHNDVIGTGPKTAGWAENGIQVDQGAVASIASNTVNDHWWDGESNWASTGIMLVDTDHSLVQANKMNDNEFSVYVVGNDNRVTNNRVNAHVESVSSYEFQAWGILAFGGDNTFIGNQLRATDGVSGIYLVGDDNTIRGGNIRGFEYPIRADEDTTFTGNPALLN